MDTAAPAVSLTPVATPTNDPTPSFGGSAGVAAGDNASVTLKVYSGTSPSGSPVRTLHATPSGATWATSSGEVLGDGTYTAQAEQSDEAGNTATSAPSTFTVDATPPAVQITSPANGSFVSSSKPTLGGTAGSATGDQTTVTVKIYAGSSVSGSPTQEVAVSRSGSSWTTGTSGPQLSKVPTPFQANSPTKPATPARERAYRPSRSRRKGRPSRLTDGARRRRRTQRRASAGAPASPPATTRR